MSRMLDWLSPLIEYNMNESVVRTYFSTFVPRRMYTWNRMFQELLRGEKERSTLPTRVKTNQLEHMSILL